MQAFHTAVVVLSMSLVLSGAAVAGAPPQLLPGAENFELTIREDSASSLPLGQACNGEAGVTLACRGFVVSLKNIGARTVRLSRISCYEPIIRFERKEPNSSSGWWPISVPSRKPCTPWAYENLRLRPGETTAYKTRLVSESRPADYFAPVTPGPYTVHARWLLWGCTEDPEGTDCLAPLQVMKANSWGGAPVGEVEFQTPVEVVSKQIEVGSPTLPDLGSLKLGFEISLATKEKSDELKKRVGSRCARDSGSSVECTVFHYSIRNLSDRPVRNGKYSCSDYSMVPEFRTAKNEWRQLQSGGVMCSMNVYFETPILPGASAEGDFTLSTLAPQFDTSALYSAGKYEIRVRFSSDACFASSDGSFCIQRPKEQVTLTSNAIKIDATAFQPE